MTMVRATVTIPETLLDAVDEMVGKGGRSAFVADALEAKVKRERLGRVLDETRGALKDSKTWPTAEATYRWVRELREDRDV